MTHFKPGRINLHYHSDKFKSYNCKEINIDKSNIITYKDFLEAKFETFRQLLIDADKVFFIVKKENKVYEVRIGLY